MRNCDDIRYQLIDQRNKLMTAHTLIIPARQERDRLQRLLDDLENRIQNARLDAQVGRTAPRALGPGGFAVSALSTLESEIRIGRLEGELVRTEADLANAERNFEDAESQVRALESTIRATEAELRRNGCV